MTVRTETLAKLQAKYVIYCTILHVILADAKNTIIIVKGGHDCRM